MLLVRWFTYTQGQGCFLSSNQTHNYPPIAAVRLPSARKGCTAHANEKQGRWVVRSEIGA